MKGKYEVIEQIYHDATMACDTIEELLKDLEGKENKIKPYLEEIKEEYSDYENKAKEILQSADIEIPEPSRVSKMGSSMGIKKEVKDDNSDSSIADMMIQGVSMGSIKIEQKLNDYDEELEHDHKILAKKFYKFQQKTIKDLKEYL